MDFKKLHVDFKKRLPPVRGKRWKKVGVVLRVICQDSGVVNQTNDWKEIKTFLGQEIVIFYIYY